MSVRETRPRPRPVGAIRAVPVLALLLVAGLPFPAGGLVAAATVPAPAHGAPAVSPVAPAKAPGLPGVNVPSEPFLNVPAIAYRELRSFQNSSLPLTVPALVPGPNPKESRAPGPPAAAAPRPAAGLGFVTGRAYDATFGQPIAGVTVTLLPFTGGCSNATCRPNSTLTATNGSFTLGGAPGPVVVAFATADYLANQTLATIADGRTANVGIVYLLHDGIATGIVVSATPDHRPLANVSVTSASRDGSLLDVGNATTLANGSFSIAVPPFPGAVTFVPPDSANGTVPSPYLPNTTYTSVAPYGRIDLGAIDLEGGVPVRATLYDEVTGRPLAPYLPTQLTVCVHRATFCLPSIIDHTGPNVSGWGMPGATTVTAYAIGYVVNATPVPDLPDTNGTVDLGRINLLPMGAAEVSVNLTGGAVPTGPWPAGRANVSVCSLAGEDVAFQITPGSSMLTADCWPIGTMYSFVDNNSAPVGATGYAIGPPLYDAIFVNVDQGSFPIATSRVNQYGPKFPPSFANLSWANLTPDRTTLVGSVDVLPGTYLQGNVSIGGVAGSLAGLFTVQACSTDNPLVCGPSVGATSSGPAPAGCAATNRTFCVPAPPGPDRVTVTGGGVLGANWTWIEVPRGCCAQDGHPTDIGWINLSGGVGEWGSVSGTAFAATAPGGAPLGGFATVAEVCPVGPPPVGREPPGCLLDVVNATSGAFNLSAPLGWDEVTVSSAGYQPNSTWLDVTGANATGSIYLTPDAVLAGRVVTPDGRGIAGAYVDACPLGLNGLCLSVGVTNGFGQYNGSLRGGAFPWGSYEVIATIAGFAQNGTWVNTTVNALTLVPTIVVWPTGLVPAPAAPPSPRGTSVAAWVTGRLVDRRTGFPVPLVDVELCAYSGNVCASVGPSTYGGTFNVSLQTGLYYLEFVAPRYAWHNVYVNGTRPWVDLGAVPLDADLWVSGRVLLAPWVNFTNGTGQGPELTMAVCGGPTLTDCVYQDVTSTGGFFNLSVPNYLGFTLILPRGNGPAGFGTASGGYATSMISTPGRPGGNGSFVAIPSSGPGAPTVTVFGSVVGYLGDGSTWNSSANATDRPAPFTEFEASFLGGPFLPFNVMQTGAGGNYAAFGPETVDILLQGWGAGYFSSGALMPGVAPGETLPAPPIALPHYGWLTARVTDANSSAVLPGTEVTASYFDPPNATPLQRFDSTNGAGFVNVTAPPFGSVAVGVNLPYYVNYSTHVAISPSATRALGTVALAPLPPPTGAWLQSARLGTNGVAPLTTVVDAKTHAVLPGATVRAITPLGLSAGPVASNGLGQFLLLAPIASPLGVSVAMNAYDPVTNYVNTSANGRTVFAKINLTGDGVVAGRIVVEPSGAPVGGATVSVCPMTFPGCANLATTNGSGIFWVAASPGVDTVTIASEQYLANVTASVTVTSDTFVSVGTIPVYAFAHVVGRVRGLPAGVPLASANVSVCSPLVPPPGACFSTTPVAPDGSFDVPVPPSIYAIYVAAPFYNATSVRVDLAAGERLDLGTVFLIADGAIAGTAIGEPTGQPIANASAIECATGLVTGCSLVGFTNAGGEFLLLAPPGPGSLTVSAPGFADNFTPVDIPAGATLDVGTIHLVEVGQAIPATLNGTVVANGSRAPIFGAVVTAAQHGATVATSTTDAAGRYALGVYWGSFDLTVSAAGYAPVRTTLAVRGNVSGLDFALAIQTFEVSGIVEEATSRAAIPGAAILRGTAVLATSDATGRYDLRLPNGTYDLTAVGPNASGATYSPLPFTVTVNGASVVRDVDLALASLVVTGEVVDARTGVPLGGAEVTAYGPALPGPTHGASTLTAANGSFRFDLPVGSYTFNVSAGGYLPFSSTQPLTGPGGPLTFAVSPLVAVRTSAEFPWLTVGGIAVGAAAAAAAGLLLWRRRPPRTADAVAAAPWGGDIVDAPEGAYLPPTDPVGEAPGP